MSPSVQQRRFTRYEFVDSPILIDIPDLCPVMLEPENISWGGFEIPETEVRELGAKLLMPGPLRRPEPGMTVKCDLEILDQPFPGLRAEIPWAAPGGDDESAWLLGMRIFVSDDQLSRFRGVMKHSLPMLRPKQ